MSLTEFTREATQAKNFLSGEVFNFKLNFFNIYIGLLRFFLFLFESHLTTCVCQRTYPFHLHS